jgi:hypothetical protein
MAGIAVHALWFLLLCEAFPLHHPIHPSRLCLSVLFQPLSLHLFSSVIVCRSFPTVARWLRSFADIAATCPLPSIRATYFLLIVPSPSRS